MKNEIVGIFVCMLMVTSLGQALEIKNMVEHSECITFDFSFSEPRLEEIDVRHGIYDRVTVDDLPNTYDYGKPCLPVKPVRVLLPQGRDLENIEVLSSGKISLGINYNIEVGGKLVPLIYNDQLTQGDNVVGSSLQEINSALTSHYLYSNIGVHIFRGYKILHVNLHPVQYVEGTGELYYYKDLKLIVETKKASITGGFRGLQKDCDIITEIVDNPSYVSTYSNHVANKVDSDETYSYIIITSESFKNAEGEYTFQDLIESKIDRGMTAGIFTVEEIVDNPDYSVNGIWGDNNPDNPFYRDETIDNIELFDDIPARIRNFIRYAYTELGTHYVLLGGDADEIVEGDDIVPLRGLFADEEGLPLNGLLDYEADDIPSDVYYACLDGNFNYDNDDHFGECADFNDMAEIDEADLYAEVWVGRACVDSTEEISNFVMKTLSYDNYEQTDNSYLFEILFIGEHLGFHGIYAYGGNYKDLVEEYVPPQFNLNKLYDRDEPWDSSYVLELLSNSPPHIINHDGHGNQDYILKMRSSKIRQLTNNEHFFLYSHSCLTGSFDNWNCYSGYREDDCIAEILTCEIPYGAFACILNARYGLGSEDSLESPSGAYDESFYKALFTENIRNLGHASHYSKEDNVWRIDENGMRWCYYQTNLFGDPELKIKDPTVKPDKPSKPSGSTSGKAGTEYTYTSSTTDPDGDQIYYWFDWGDGTNSGWIGPLASGATGSAKHKWTSQGNYQIKVKAKDTADLESEWSDLLPVSMPKNKSLTDSLFLRFLERFPIFREAMSRITNPLR